MRGCIYMVIHGSIAYSSKSLEHTCPSTENWKIYGHPCRAIPYGWKKKEVDVCALTGQACQSVVLNKEKNKKQKNKERWVHTVGYILCKKKRRGDSIYIHIFLYLQKDWKDKQGTNKNDHPPVEWGVEKWEKRRPGRCGSRPSHSLSFWFSTM